MKIRPVRGTACAAACLVIALAAGCAHNAKVAHERDAVASAAQGRALLDAGDFKGAVQAYETAVALNPDDAQLHLQLADALVDYIATLPQLRKFAVASRIQEHLQRAIELDPDLLPAREALLKYQLNAPPLMGGGHDLAEQQAVEIARRDPVRGLYATGVIKEYDGDLATAISDYRQALAATPQDRKIRYALAGAYRKARQFADAFSIYDELARDDASDLRARFEMGATAAAWGERLDEGVEALKEYLARAPRHADPKPAAAHYQLGRIYERLSRVAEACAEYREAAALDPNNEDYKSALAAPPSGAAGICI